MALPDFKFQFDREGPGLGPVRLVQKSALGFCPLGEAVLREQLADVFGQDFDCADLVSSLDGVCHALNIGDVITKAAFATQFLRLPLQTQNNALTKASPEDPDHPGRPKGAPDGKGGEFRPKDDGADGPFDLDRKRKVGRYRARKSFRSVIRRVLTTKRAVRLLGEWVVDAIPIVDEASGIVTVADDLKLMRDIADDLADSETAIAFAEKGPQALDQLMVSQDELSFSSYEEFLTLSLGRAFGRAGDNLQYHHIVEQGPNAALFPPELLNSTSNIIKLPKVIHEDVTAIYNSNFEFKSGTQTLRSFLRDKPFDQQKRWGLWALYQAGVIDRY